MVLDFADLKAMVQEILGPFDHRVINDIPPFDRAQHHGRAAQPSTSSRRSARRLAGQERVRVVRVEVWENETACAVYEP